MIVFGICVLVLTLTIALVRSYEKEAKRKAADLAFVHLVGRTLELEADVDRPLSTLVRQAEMVAEEEWRQKTGEPMVTEFSDCINCGKNAIYVAGRRAPVSWVLTDPCRLHKPKS